MGGTGRSARSADGISRKLTTFIAGCASLAIVLAFAGSAEAVSFGADLTQPVLNGTPSCGALSQPSCLAFSSIPTSYAPASGIVDSVSVKTGSSAGPMQVVVMRSFTQNNPNSAGTPNYFCCFLEAYGPTFTPKPNSVTTIPTSLEVIEDPTPAAGDYNTVARGDFLALSILDSTTSVPLGLSQNALSLYYAPAPQAATTPAPSLNGIPGSLGAGQVGYMLMLSGDLIPAGSGGTGGGGAPGGGGGTPTPTPGPTPTPTPGGGVVPTAPKPVTFPRKNGTLKGNQAQVRLACRLAATCRGNLALRNNLEGIAAKKKPRSVVLGRTKFKIGGGKSATVKVKLNASGRKFAAGHKKVTVYGVVTIAKRTVTVRLTLTQPAHA